MQLRRGWRQARWEEPLVYELGSPSNTGYIVPYSSDDKEIMEYLGTTPEEDLGEYYRRELPGIPGLSEVETVRHFTRLSQMSYGVDVGPVPLGSCTMKYNPKISEEIASDPRIKLLHPYQDEETVQGLLEILYELERWLAEITGMDRCSLQTPAGAAGELAGALMIRKYFLDRGETRDEMLVPDSAHGTNPASAAMAGFKVVKIPTSEHGTVDLEAVRTVLSERTAGIMLTNPNTLGIFEDRILELADLLHSKGALLYYDGANLNGIMGIVRPGDMGFDVVHLNIHKTFSAPHGGGGPGAGVVCAKGELVDYLPRPLIEKRRGKYYWDYSCERCIGRVRAFYGNIIPLVKAYVYIAMLGGEGLRETAIQSVINTNYFIALMKDVRGYELPYDPNRPRKHELVLSAKPLKRDTGVTAEDVAKALLDHGLHAPTIYFPLIVEEALMIEFTESEPRREIERYAEALRKIAEKAYENPEEVKRAPRNTSVTRLDTIYANHPRTVTPTYRVLRRRQRGEKLVL
ncbi:aminomethyl-transferring glycine dehydrogenase subunit GcvPB [Hyperthermus butylicus]|uniref:aminomethyl-transferring glycine dehydrogenase subunit GcvPB n=1 Tax=Hyperthermus butylicus TaxID=54248 RepID=UPI00064ED56E|nr:aminomethyl-transferring glycine dehydrogenase subunit GcvPB [Hyperthermus butylicus]